MGPGAWLLANDHRRPVVGHFYMQYQGESPGLIPADFTQMFAE